MERTRGIPLHAKILIGLVLGAICGSIGQALWAKDDTFVWTVANVMEPIGTIFMRMLFMIVVPLLFSALVMGVMEIGDARKVGRVGLLSLLMTLLLSGIAVGIGITAVNLVKPGEGIDHSKVSTAMPSSAAKDAEKAAAKAKESREKKPADYVLEMVPTNPVKSAAEAMDGGLFALMFFGIVFGLAMSKVDAEKSLPVKQFLEGLFAVSQQVIEFALRMAPYGVFALGFKTTALLGLDALGALGKYAILVLVALAFHQFVVYSLAILTIAKRSPLEFFRQIRTVMVTAFATSSSNATLPTALKVAEEEVGLPRDISSFVLTVGATANQNGTALFEGITVLFLAQFYGIHLEVGQQVTVMFLSILAGVGTAGVPGGSWPLIAIVLLNIGVPVEGIGLCIGIDRILDMSRTVLNVTGDITIAACVTKLMGGKVQDVPEEALA
ncbi:MAG: dicarboxylate/amino acid:cation symporter [Armatimonadetes bacterium]|nr:dicarboxylate/amino acid:cation symporter [Armatimonadota bacterium]